MALHEARLDDLDVEGVLNFAEHVLTNAGRLWTELSLDQKQRLQQVLFPKGVTYSDVDLPRFRGRITVCDITLPFSVSLRTGVSPRS